MSETNRRRGGRVGVVGGGLGGLAAACTLAARGYAVVLLERNEWLGGKAAVREADGFRFDMGPTILTLPSVLARIFREAGRRLEDYVELVRLGPQWRSFFTDGTTLDLWAEPERMSAAAEALAPGAGASYLRFLDHAARLHDISERYFFWRPVGGLRDMVRFSGGWQPGLLGDLFALGAGRSVAATVRSHVADARVAQMLDHFTQYVGSAPDSSPAVLCGIAHMQTGEGVWYPQGGTAAVPRALARLAAELGVEIRRGTGVKRILLHASGGVRGVETEAGETIALDAVVSNADAVRTHRELLGGPPAARFARRRSYEPACSGVVLYLGLDRGYDHLLHHNFVFSRDPEEEFTAIYRQGEPAADPTCYVCAPARTEPGVAPPGGEALYVLAHTPYLRAHHDWDSLYPAYRQVILNKLKTTAGMEDIEERIRFEDRLTPADIHRRYGVLNGAIYGIASHGRWLGAFKPSNRSPDVPGLYLAGGAAHPGPGMPMVLMSGWIAADALDQEGVAGRASTRSWDGPREHETAKRPLPVSSLGPPALARADSRPPVLSRHSPRLVGLFRRYVKRRHLARQFHGVRLSRQDWPTVPPDAPLLVVLNHPSWWDPLVALALTELFPDRAHFAPMDAAALGRYRFFDRLGLFGVELGSFRGAREFLRTGEAILSRPRTALWVTAQGRFADPRERPPGLRPGVAHLVRRVPRAIVLPLALEYPFWDERCPEALARFGPPLVVEPGREQDTEVWQRTIEGALSRTQDALAEAACRRDASAFETLVPGRTGIGGLYDGWRRLRAFLRRGPFSPGHGVPSVVPVAEGTP